MIAGTGIRTHSGRMLSLSNPQAEHIDPDDIAWALAHLCRYVGHVPQFYSVAQHSVVMTRYALADKPEAAPYVLLHDAAEAYIGDISRPLKMTMNRYAQHWLDSVEFDVDCAIRARFGLGKPGDDIRQYVRRLDERALLTELRDLMVGGGGPQPGAGVLPFDEPIVPWPIDRALERFREMMAKLFTKGVLR